MAMTSASTKLPKKSQMIGSANGAKTLRTSATPQSTHSIAPSMADMGRGTGSVTHQMPTQLIMAARMWALGVRLGMGVR